MKNMPLVSICIPTYNRAGMVGDAIASALRQTYCNIEILVVDNASSDSTDAVVAGFRDNRLKYIKNPRNLGLFGNFNRCIELSSGDYIHILHSDDTIDDRFIEICMDFFQRHPGVAMTFTSARIQSGDHSQDLSFSDQDRIFPAPEGFRTLLLVRSLIICPSVIVQRRVYDEVGKYSLEYPYSSDYYQWMKITLRYDVGFVHDAWLSYRQGEHSESYRLVVANLEGYTDTLNIYRRVIGDLGNDYLLYAREFNTALIRYIRDLLFVGFVREKIIKKYHSSDITGKAVGAWSLLYTVTVAEKIQKLIVLIEIMGAGLVMRIPHVRKLVQRIYHDRIGYY